MSTVIQRLASKPGHLVRRLQQTSNALFAGETAGFDLTSPQYAALVAIEEAPGIDQRTLAARIAFDRTTIGGLVERLVLKRLVTRSVGADRRSRILKLTAAGARTLREIEPAVERVQERLLAPLSRDEQRVFIDALRALVAREATLPAKDGIQ